MDTERRASSMPYWCVRIAGVALVSHGVIALLDRMARILHWALTHFFVFQTSYLVGAAIGCASIVIGSGAAAYAKWARIPAIILGAVGGSWYGYVYVLQRRSFFFSDLFYGPWQMLELEINLAGVVILGASLVCFSYWRQPDRGVRYRSEQDCRVSGLGTCAASMRVPTSGQGNSRERRNRCIAKSNESEGDGSVGTWQDARCR